MPTEMVFNHPVQQLSSWWFGTNEAARLSRIEQRLDDIEQALRDLLEQQGKSHD